LTLATEKAFKYTGFVKGYNTRIRQGSKPGKHRTRPDERKVNVDDFGMAVIRRTVHNFYVTNDVLSCPKLLPVIKEKIYFLWGVDSLRN
jgi:hypothetical protein